MRQRLLSEALDAMDDAVMAVNEDVEIFFYNRSFADLFGYSEIDPPLKSFLEMIDPGARGNTREFEEELKREGVGAGAVKNYGGIRFRRKNHSLFSADVRLHPLAVEGKRAPG